MNILETIRTHKLIVLGSALGLLIIMLIVAVIILVSGTKKPSFSMFVPHREARQPIWPPWGLRAQLSMPLIFMSIS